MNETETWVTRPYLFEIYSYGIPIATIIVNLPAIFLILWSVFHKESTKNIHLLSVGITDAFVGAVALFLVQTYVNTQGGFSYYDCCLRFYLFSITYVASMLQVLGICVQRVKIVLKKNTPQYNQQFRRRAEWCVIGLSWIISVMVNAIPFGLWTKESDILYCSFDSVHGKYAKQVNHYLGVLYSCVILMVLLAMVTLFKIVYCRGQLQLAIAWGPKDVRICVTICIMALTFVLTTLPLAILLLTHDYFENKRRPRSICMLVSLLNSTINPFVYLYRLKENRDRLKKTVCCMLSSCCRPSSVHVWITSGSSQHRPIQ